MFLTGSVDRSSFIVHLGHFLGLALLAAQPRFSESTLATVRRAPAVASPVEGYLTIGDHFIAHKQLERARQVLAYALLYAPDDPRLLGRLAMVELDLGRPAEAWQLARATLDVNSGDSRAQQVFHRLASAPRPVSSASAASPAAAPSPQSSPAAGSPAASAASAAPPAPAATPAMVASLAPGLKVALANALDLKDSTLLKGLESPLGVLDPESPGDQLVAWRVMRAIDAAIRSHMLAHPKDKVESLDLEKLRSERLLPKDLDFSGFPSMSIVDGKLNMVGFETLEALDKKLEPYREILDVASKMHRDGLVSEAYVRYGELVKRFPTDPGALERLLRVTQELGLDFEAVSVARALAIVRPSDPRNLFTLAVLYFRTSNPVRAREVAALVPRLYRPSFYTPASSALVRLVDSRVSQKAMQELLEKKDALLAGEWAPQDE